MTANQYIYLDGYNYAVEQTSYIRNWQRQQTLNINAVVFQTTFIDKGPGIWRFNFNIVVTDWSRFSLGSVIAQTPSQQITNIEASYQQTSPSNELDFTDPFGNQLIANPPMTRGVYFINLTQRIMAQSTPQTPFVLYEVELWQAGKNTV